METEKNCSPHALEPRRRAPPSPPSGAVYGFGFIGAVIYFIHHATSFGMGVLGVLKAIVWPALLVYELLRFLKM